MRFHTSLLVMLAALSPALAIPGSPQVGHHGGHGGPQGSQNCPGSICTRNYNDVISELDMDPVPGVDGCWYVRTFRDPLNVTSAIHTPRPAVGSILSLIARTSTNDGYGRWIKSQASEVWNYYGGAPLTFTVAKNDGTPAVTHVVGPDIFAGQRPQIAIQRGVWLIKRTTGAWTLTGGSSSPGSMTDLSDVEIAPVGWWPKTS